MNRARGLSARFGRARNLQTGMNLINSAPRVVLGRR